MKQSCSQFLKYKYLIVKQITLKGGNIALVVFLLGHLKAQYPALFEIRKIHSIFIKNSEMHLKFYPEIARKKLSI